MYARAMNRKSAARSRSLRLTGAAALLAFAAAGSCAGDENLAPVPLPSIPCDSAVPGPGLWAIPTTTVSVQIDPGSDANLTALRADFSSYLPKLWQGTSVTVSEGTGAPPPAPLTVWISTGDAARDAVG